MRLALCVLLMSGVAAADTITTKDGVVHEGKVVRELERGYLFRDSAGATGVLPFDQIDDVNVAPTAALAPTQPKASLKLDALRAEQAALRIEQSETGLWGGICMVTLGAISVGVGVRLINDSVFYNDGATMVGFGTVMGVAGFALAVTGFVVLIVKAIRKIGYASQIDAIDWEMGR